MRKAFTVLFAVVFAVAVWFFLCTGTPRSGLRLTLKNIPVKSIELSWAGSNRMITASNDCTTVLQVMQKARQSQIPASPPFGSLTLNYADGTTNRFDIQPAGRFAAVELIDQSGGYAISMSEMLDTLEEVGLKTKE